jgi:hypothetical protein
MLHCASGRRTKLLGGRLDLNLARTTPLLPTITCQPYPEIHECGGTNREDG